MEFLEDRVIGIGRKHDLSPVLFADQQIGRGELIEFFLDMAGRCAEFICQFTEIGLAGWVGEKAHDDADAHF